MVETCLTTENPRFSNQERRSGQDLPGIGWYSMTTRSTLAQLSGEEAGMKSYSLPSQSILTNSMGLGDLFTTSSNEMVFTSVAVPMVGCPSAPSR